MMSVMKYLALLMLCMLLGVHASPAPTAAPSSAPTSASTSGLGDDDDDSSQPGDDDDDDSDTSVVAPPGKDGNLSNVTNVSNMSNVTTTSASPTTTAGDTPPVTRFTATLYVANATDFNSEDYIKSIVATTGVPAANVEITVEFVVKVSYEFTEDVTEADVKAAAAHMAGVEQTAVTVTLSTVRRLKQEKNLGRRLAVVAEVEIKTADATAADTIKTNAADESKIASSMQTAVGKTVTATVAVAPATEVRVDTKITSSSDIAVSAPDATALANKMTELTGKTMTATVDVVTTTTTAIVPESSDARKGSTRCVVGVLSVLMALALSS